MSDKMIKLSGADFKKAVREKLEFSKFLILILVPVL